MKYLLAITAALLITLSACSSDPETGGGLEGMWSSDPPGTSVIAFSDGEYQWQTIRMTAEDRANVSEEIGSYEVSARAVSLFPEHSFCVLDGKKSYTVRFKNYDAFDLLTPDQRHISFYRVKSSPLADIICSYGCYQ